MSKKYKIVDVALDAGVSTATVSRVLNNQPSTEATRERVLKSIKKLEYKTNLDGKALRSRKTRRILLSFAYLSNPFYTFLAEKIEESLSKCGYHILLNASANTEQSIKEQLEKVASGLVDGFVFAPNSFSVATTIALRKLQVPTVVFGTIIRNSLIDSIVASELSGLEAAVEHLVSSGKKRILLFNGPKNTIPGKNRSKYFCKIIRELDNSTIQSSIYFAKDFSFEGASSEINRLDIRKNYDAVICGNDLMAVAVLNHLLDRQVSVPERVAVIGIDNDLFGNFLRPQLSSIDLDVPSMGQRAAELLLHRIADPRQSRQQVVVESSYVRRESS